ncbi:MAG: zinc ribbon domain-containing protein [Oscillospiraceae bacterium]|nr:zinc ribbon domain-containing protein [Oscillospiraceae bacterium]
MFCQKCGARAIDGAEFCQKCGAKLVADTSAEQPTVSQATQVHQPTSSQTNSMSTDKKKSKLPVIIGAVAAVVVLAIVFVVLNWEDKIDYVATVRAYEPLSSSQGLPYTCGEVFDKYIPNAEWDVRKSDDEVFVDISGTATGADSELLITIQIEEAEDHAIMKPASVKLNGEEPAENVFFALFVAYDEKDDDLSHLDELISEVDFALRGGQLAGTFTDEVEGISFSYPDWWVTLDTPSEYEIVKMISPRNSGNHTASFSVTLVLDTDPFDVFTGDETLVRDSVNENHTFLDYGDVMLGDIPAKALRYQTSGLNGDDIVIAFGYTVGGNVYWVTCSYAESTSAVYESIFQAMIESYAVTAPVSTSEYSGQIVFDGVPASIFLDEYIDTVIDSLGTPDDYSYGYGVNYCIYDGLDLEFDYEGLIYTVQMEAQHCTFDGIALNTTQDKLIGMLGNPTSEGDTTSSRRILFEGTYYDVDVHYITFQQFSAGMGIRFEFDNDSSTVSYVYIWSL